MADTKEPVNWQGRLASDITLWCTHWTGSHWDAGLRVKQELYSFQSDSKDFFHTCSTSTDLIMRPGSCFFFKLEPGGLFLWAIITNGIIAWIFIEYLWKYVLMKTSALKDGSEQALNGENKSSFLFFLQIDFPSFSSIFPTLHPAQCFISTSLGKTNSDIFQKDTIVTMVVNNRQIKWPLPQH